MMTMTATQTLRVLIVDDEPLARERVRFLLANRPGVEVVGDAEDGAAAVRAILDLQPTLVFLDIQMPGLTGFEVIRQIGAERMPAVVFVTAYDQYAIQAFDVHAVDYLLKPFDLPRPVGECAVEPGDLQSLSIGESVGSGRN